MASEATAEPTTTTTAPAPSTGPSRPITVRDVSHEKFIAAYAKHLKRSGRVTVPKWVDLVKTGHFKELAPTNPDWYFIRVASLARKVYLKGGVGVGEYRKIYGGKINRGSRPSRHALASGAVIRHALKNLETLKVVEKNPKGGRSISSTGQRDLDRIAGQVATRN